MSQAHFIYVADVFCPWCYAFAPVMRRVAASYPDFPVRVIGGNLISRPMTLREIVAGNPGQIDFWREVESVSGRSLEGAIRAAESGSNARLFSPGADEILVVLREMAPGADLEQLIYLEELFYAHGRDMFTDECLEETARHWGISGARFERALDEPAALAAAEQNLVAAANLMGEITSYPSVLLARNDAYFPVSRGYVQFETVASRMEAAMQNLGLEDEPGEYCSLYGACHLSGRRGR